MGGAGDRLVVIGRLGRPHGVQGELRAAPTGPTLASMRVGEDIAVTPRDGGSPVSMRIEALRLVDRGVLLRLGGVATREDAAALTGSTLAVPEARLAELDEPDEFYVRDLVGCAVYEGANRLGEVVDIYAGAANDALVVAAEARGELLVPFTRDAVVELDLPGRVVRIRPDLLTWADG